MKNQNRASDDEGVLRLDAAECAELESALDAEASVIPELARLFGAPPRCGGRVAVDRGTPGHA